MEVIDNDEFTIENLHGFTEKYATHAFGAEFVPIYRDALITGNKDNLIEFFCRDDFKKTLRALDYFVPFSKDPDPKKGFERLPYSECIADILTRLNQVPRTMMTDVLYESIMESYRRYCSAKAAPVNKELEYDVYFGAEDWTVEFAEYEKQIAEIKQECAARIKEINTKYNERKKEVARRHNITVTNINNAMKLVKMYATTEPENLTTEQKLFLTMYNTPKFCEVYKKTLEISGQEVVNPEFGLGSDAYQEKLASKVIETPLPKPKVEERQKPKQFKTLDDVINFLDPNRSKTKNMDFNEKYEYYKSTHAHPNTFYLKYIPANMCREDMQKLSFFLHEYVISHDDYMRDKNSIYKNWIIRDEIESCLSDGFDMQQLKDYMINSFGDDPSSSDMLNNILDKFESIFKGAL